MNWTNTASGGWNTAANWDPNTIPGAGDTAVITNTGVTVSLNGATTIDGLTLGGFFAGTTTLSLNNQTLALNGPLTVFPSGSFTVDSGALVGNTNAALSGTIGWSAATLGGTLTLAPGGLLNISTGNDHNMPNCTLTNNGTVLWASGTLRGGGSGTTIYNYGLWDAQSDQAFNTAYGGNVIFNNLGTFRKSAGGGSSTLQGGVVFNQLGGAVDTQTGNLVLQGGGSFSGGFVTTNANGTTYLSVGNFTINGTVTGSNFVENAASLTGVNVIRGALTWVAGLWNGATSVTISSNSTVIAASGGGQNDFPNMVVTNYGTFTWASGTLRGGGSGTTIYNYGLWDVQSDQAFNTAYGGNVIFNNLGTVRKSAGGGNTALQGGVVFNQLGGAVDTLTGNLVLQGGGNFNGGFVTTNTTGTTYLSVGSFNINGTVTGTNFVENAASLTGVNVIRGALTWVAGLWNGATSVTISPNSTVIAASGGGQNDMPDTVVTNYGTFAWANGTLRGGGGGGTTIYNYGLWDAQSDYTFNTAYGGNVIFNNLGTVRKSAGGGSTALQGGVVFNQLGGAVDTQTGNLVLQGGGNFTGGFVTTNTTGTTYLSSGNFNLNGTVTGSNVVENAALLTGANVIRGALTWQAGSWNNAVVTVSSNSTLIINTASGNHLIGACVLTNYGTVNWRDDTLYAGAGTVFYNYGLWNAQDNQVLNNYYGGAGTVFNNFGNLRKSGGLSPGYTLIGNPVTFNNTGIVDVQTGVLLLQGIGNFTGGFVTTNSTGTTYFSSGNFNLNGTATGSNVVENSGSLFGTNVIRGALTWQSGSWNGTVVTVSSNSVLHINTANGNHLIGACVLTNYGTVNWSGDTLYSGAGTVFYNYGLWNAQDNQTLNNYYGGAGTVFNNLGTLRKSGGVNTGYTLIGNPVTFNNTGIVDMPTGFLVLQGTGNFTGGYLNTNSTGTTYLSSGSFTINGTVTGNNVIENPGNLVGVNVIRGALTWQSGSWNNSVITVSSNSVLHINTASGNHTLGGCTLTNYGTVNWHDDTLYAGAGATFQNYDLWNAQDDHALNNYYGGAGTLFNNAGTFRKSGGAAATTIENVSFFNPGTLAALSGTVSFNTSPVLAGGTLNFGIGDSNTFGRVSIPGTANLDGGVSALLLNGYTPPLGSNFVVMTFGAATGTFTDYSGLNAGGGITFNPVLSATDLTLTTAATNFTAVAPSIINQPVTQTINYGGTATLSVTVSGSPVLMFQWHQNNVALPGATNAILVLSNATFAQTGSYTVGVTNSAGGRLSQAAQVTVNPILPAFTLQPPANTTVPAGSNTSFTVAVIGGPAPTLQWQHAGTNLVDLGRISGAHSTTLSLSNLLTTDGGNYVCIASNAYGVAVSSTAVLHVDFPDMVPSNLIAPAIATPGQAVPIVFDITNRASGRADGPWVNQFYLAENTSGTNAVSLGTAPFNGSIPPFSSITFTQTVITPGNIFGTRYFGVVVDVNNNVLELNETNNTVWSATGTIVSAPDLVITNLSAPATAQLGSSFTVNWTRRNIGSIATVSAGQDQILLSTSSNSISGARLLATVAAAIQAPGSDLPRNQSVTIPLLTSLPAGNYWLIVAADSPDAQPESDEANNLASRSLTLTQPPLPDLAIASFSPPTLLVPGAATEARWTVTNSGTLGLTNGVWRERISFTNATSGLLTFNEWAFTNSLAIGGSLSRTQFVNVPLNLPANPGRLTLVVDIFDTVVELTETNNFTQSATNIPVTPRLFLTFSANNIIEGGSNVLATVTRNGDTNAAISVTLSNNFPARLVMTNQVTIPAGANAATFPIALPVNGTVDGIVFAHLSVSATNYVGTTELLSLTDESSYFLTLTLSTNQMLEGMTLSATVTRSLVTTQSLTVYVGVGEPLSLFVPPTVTIASNQASAIFAVLAPNNTYFDGTRTNSVRVGALGFTAATKPVVVFDDDQPTVSLELTPKSVSENGGAQAASLTVRLSAAAPRKVVVDLESSNPTLARVPVQVTIPAGQTAAGVPVSVIDNIIVGTNLPVAFTGYLHESGSEIRLATTAPVSLTVLDNDGPALQLALDHDLVGEGLAPAAHGTVTRNGSTLTTLVVTLTSSDITEATVPPTVTIPSGSASATFDLASINDGVTDGSQPVMITASAAGFIGAEAGLTVSDSDLPDLHVISVTAPASGKAEASFSMSYRVENQGRVATGTNLLTKVYLRTDPLAFGGTLVASYTLPSPLAPGQFFEQSLSGYFPTATGTYYLVVTTDADSQFNETLEDNNTRISSPITVTAPYTATVQTAVNSAPTGTTIPLTGHATSTDLSPAANVAVTIQVWHNGFLRTLLGFTDNSGDFTATFRPLPSEAGSYDIGANHPGVTTFTAQDTFTLVGLKLSPVASSFNIHEGQQAGGALTISNLSSIALSGLSATVVSQPSGWNTLLTLTNTTLPGDTNVSLAFTVTPGSTGIGTIVVRVSATGGVSADAVLTVANAPLFPQLVAVPAPVYAGMVVGQQTIVSFKVVNQGGLVTGPVNVNLPAIPWLKLASAAPLAPLNPGETNIITLLLSPTNGTDLTTYSGSLLVDAGNTVLNVPFEFRALSEAKGNLRVSVVDELTYYAEGAPKVTNAFVIVRDAITHEAITNGFSDAQGAVAFKSLAEGYYEVEVSAAKHPSFIGNTVVTAGKTNEFEVFISRTLVEYIWTVVPTEIEDRTKIVIETIFETVVPLPVVTIEPAYIDLADLTEPETQIQFRISNHGLIAAQDVSIELPAGGPITFESIASDIGTLPAQSSITIPVKVKFPGAAALSSFNGKGKIAVAGSALTVTRDQCYYYVREKHVIPCGKRKNVYYSTSAIRDSKATGCTSTSAGGNGGASGNGPVLNGGPLSPYGTTSGPGGSSFFAPRIIQQKEQCGCENFVPTCFELGGSLAAPTVSAFGTEASAKLTGSGKICTCCDDDGPGFTKEINAGVEGSLKLEIPISAPDPSVEFTEGTLHFKGALHMGGLVLDASPKLKGEFQYSEECHGKNPKKCINITAEAPLELNAKLGPEFDVTDNGVSIGKASAFAKVFIKSGVSYKFSDCNGVYESKLCISAINAGYSLTVGVGSAEYSSGGNVDLAPEVCTANQLAGFLAQNSSMADQAAASLQPQINRLVQEMERAYAMQSTPTASTKPLIWNNNASSGGVCARVKLRIEQDLIVARNAFNANLQFINRDTANPMQNIGVKVIVYDTDGHDVTDRFGLRKPVVNGLGNVDGTGALAVNSTGSASFILVPTSEAAPETPTTYFVGGTLSYTVGGLTIGIPLTAAPITVYPDPRLHVKYFHQRDVFSDDPFTRDIIEPTIPFNLAVMVQNTGHGPAKKVRIVSGQPEIVENEKGLLINFKIIGTEVAGQSVTPSLTAVFGDIGPGQIGIARWLLTSTLQGLFINYSATFEHTDSLGKTNLSLIDEVTIHEMNHLVYADGAFADGLPDFLVNDDPDPDDYPDHIYLSNGTTNKVSVVLQGTIDGAATVGHSNVLLTASVPNGWTYLRMADPANGAMQLTGVTRSDGKPILVGTNVWVTDRTFIGHSERPIRENILHLLDYNSTGSYTLTYGPLAAEDHTTPASSVTTLPPYVQNQFPVSWSGVDAGGGAISYYDIFVADNFGPFIPWLQNIGELGAIFQGTNGHRYEFYSVATDNSGNREPAPIYADTATTIALSNNPPTLSLNGPTIVDEGSNVVITVTASDPEMPLQSLLFTLATGPVNAVINPGTGEIQWPTGEVNGPSTNLFTVIARDNGLPPLSATNALTVVVREVNQAPVLPALPSFRISEGQTLRYTNSATDPDLPAQTLTYSFGSGVPTGLTLNSSNAVLNWTPNSTQGGHTNLLKMIVTDNGSPALSATQNFSIAVLDTSADFTVSIGKTNVLAGQSGQLPISLNTGWQLTNLTFSIDTDPTRLGNFTVAPLAAGLSSATLAPAGAGHLLLNFVADPLQPLALNAQLARLDFTTGTNTHSAFVPLTVQDIQGRRLTGETVTNAASVPGQVVYIATEPLLEAWLGTSSKRKLTLYGRPGASYELDYNTNLLGSNWQFGWRTPMTNLSAIFDANAALPQVFYRAMEFSANPPILEMKSASPTNLVLLLYGQSGMNYAILTGTNLVNTADWSALAGFTLTNSFQFINTGATTNPQQFFRARKP